MTQKPDRSMVNEDSIWWCCIGTRRVARPTRGVSSLARVGHPSPSDLACKLLATVPGFKPWGSSDCSGRWSLALWTFSMPSSALGERWLECVAQKCKTVARSNNCIAIVSVGSKYDSRRGRGAPGWGRGNNRD